MAVLLKAFYRFNVIPIKISMTFFIELEETILKVIWSNSKATMSTKEQYRRYHNIRFQNIMQSYSNKNIMALASKTDRSWWLTPEILATQEAEIRRIVV
jgi:hypothetical protein